VLKAYNEKISGSGSNNSDDDDDDY
jgi:hypothetical protein